MKKLGITAFSVVIALCIALPVLTSEKIDNSKVKPIIDKELQAMKERAAQTTCPLTGSPVADGKGTVFMGHFIGTCCDNCAAKVEKDPLTALLKLRKAGQEPALAEGYTYSKTCPLSGEPAAEGLWKIKNNAKVSFCCADCVAAFEKDPAAVFAKMEEAKTAPVLITLDQNLCPVSGHAAVGATSLVYQGKQVNLCCAACKAEFEAKPDEYMQTMADMGFVLASAQ